ncbi:MAG: type II toxin-antitoxin system PemK/MazF family toxin [Candidatus Omnitrophica bacterium]|nr:type II toxin-antitoxin system PemK/MazF family toxin [Candidatus Omnitrophota bacterium]
MRRGEVWLANLLAPVGRRPVVLLSRNEAYLIRTSITIAEVTTVIRGIPVEVKLDKEDGLAKPCVVNLDTITTIPKNQLKRKIVLLKPEKIARINLAIRFALAL